MPSNLSQEPLCPCGSNRNYRDCCQKNDITNFLSELKQKGVQKEWQKIEQVENSLFSDAKEISPSDSSDFLGLTNEEMHRILSGKDTLKNNFLFELNNKIDITLINDTPIAKAILFVLNNIANSNAKSIPSSCDLFIGNYLNHYLAGSSSENIPDPEIVFFLTENSSLIEKQNNDYVLTAKGKKAIEMGVDAELYFEILTTLFEKFDWSTYPEEDRSRASFYQQIYLFLIFLIHQKCNKNFQLSDFTALLLEAFPALHDYFDDLEEMNDEDDDFFESDIEDLWVDFLFPEIFMATGLIEESDSESNIDYEYSTTNLFQSLITLKH